MVFPFAGKDVFHVIHGEVHLVMALFHQLGKANVEFRNVAFVPFQHEFVAPGDHLQVREIGTEFREYFVADPENLNGVHGFQMDGFLHTHTNILHLFGFILEKCVFL